MYVHICAYMYINIQALAPNVWTYTTLLSLYAKCAARGPGMYVYTSVQHTEIDMYMAACLVHFDCTKSDVYTDICMYAEIGKMWVYLYMAACLVHLDCTGVVCVYIYVCMRKCGRYGYIHMAACLVHLECTSVVCT